MTEKINFLEYSQSNETFLSTEKTIELEKKFLAEIAEIIKRESNSGKKARMTERLERIESLSQVVAVLEE